MSTAEVYNEDMRQKTLKASGDDLIRRRDVINAIFDAPIADLSDVTAKKLDLVSAVIQIQPERKKGKWRGWQWEKCVGFETEKYKRVRGYTCSECQRGTAVATKFCPNCGADMRERNDKA